MTIERPLPYRMVEITYEDICWCCGGECTRKSVRPQYLSHIARMLFWRCRTCDVEWEGYGTPTGKRFVTYGEADEVTKEQYENYGHSKIMDGMRNRGRNTDAQI